MRLSLRLFGRDSNGRTYEENTSVSAKGCGGNGIPLPEIPTAILEEYPGLQPVPYIPQRCDTCMTAAALVHNACRLEMVDMAQEVLPGLHARAPVPSEVSTSLAEWWAGFARLMLTTSLVDDELVTIACSDILADFDKDATQIAKMAERVRERNQVTLETAARAMGRAVGTLQRDGDADAIQHLTAAWRQLAEILCNGYMLVEQTCHAVDVWRRGEIAVHPGLEMRVAAFYTNKKRWGNDMAKKGELVVLLTRWMGSEHLMRDWANRNLSKREARTLDKWLDNYRATRVEILESFRALA